MHLCPAYMDVYAPHGCLVLMKAREGSSPRLEWQSIRRIHMGPGNGTWFVQKSTSALNCWGISPSLSIGSFYSSCPVTDFYLVPLWMCVKSFPRNMPNSTLLGYRRHLFLVTFILFLPPTPQKMIIYPPSSAWELPSLQFLTHTFLRDMRGVLEPTRAHHTYILQVS